MAVAGADIEQTEENGADKKFVLGQRIVTVLGRNFSAEKFGVFERSKNTKNNEMNTVTCLWFFEIGNILLV